MGSDNANDGCTGFTPNGKAARKNMDVVSILMTKAEFRFVRSRDCHGPRYRGRRRPATCRQDGPGVPMRRHAARSPHPNTRASASIAANLHDSIRFEVPVPDTFLAAGDRQRETFFTFTQEALCLLPFADVSHHDLDRGIPSDGIGAPAILMSRTSPSRRTIRASMDAAGPRPCQLSSCSRTSFWLSGSRTPERAPQQMVGVSVPKNRPLPGSHMRSGRY